MPDSFCGRVMHRNSILLRVSKKIVAVFEVKDRRVGDVLNIYNHLGVQSSAQANCLKLPGKGPTRYTKKAWRLHT